MKQIRLLLGIDDAEYGQRLLAFLLAQGFGDGIHLYTDPGFFGEEMEHLAPGMYDAAVLSSPFFEAAEACGISERLNRAVPCIRHLLSSPQEPPKTEQVLYRYRPVSALLDLLERLQNPPREKSAEMVLCENAAGPAALGAPARRNRWIWCSPNHHELLPAVVLAAAKERAQHGPVLLADLQENSMIDRIVQRADAKTVTDAVYLLGSHPDALAECAVNWEGVRLLLPAASVQEIGQLKKEHWKMLDAALSREAGECFLLFDSVCAGFEQLAEGAGICVAVLRQEPRSADAGERYLRYLRERFPELEIRILEVPFLAGDIPLARWPQTVLRDERLKNAAASACAKPAGPTAGGE